MSITMNTTEQTIIRAISNGMPVVIRIRRGDANEIPWIMESSFMLPHKQVKDAWGTKSFPTEEDIQVFCQRIESRMKWELQRTLDQWDLLFVTHPPKPSTRRKR